MDCFFSSLDKISIISSKIILILSMVKSFKLLCMDLLIDDIKNNEHHSNSHHLFY